MLTFAEHFQSFSFSALVGLALVVGAILTAICLNYHVKTGVRVGWFSFFLETDRKQPTNESKVNADQN